MALFGKKKLSLEEILEGIKALSDEEKAKALSAMQGEDKAEPTEEVEQVEDAEVETTESEKVEGEQGEETEAVEGVEETTEKPVEPTEETEGAEMPAEPTEEADATLAESESATDEMANDNRDEIIKQLTDKVNEMSEQLKGLLELQQKMEEYTSKQAESFGYKGNVLGAKKDFKDMSTDELKAHAMKGI